MLSPVVRRCCCPASVVRHCLPVVCRPRSVVFRPSLFARSLSPGAHRPLSVVFLVSPAVRRPLSVVWRLCSYVVRRPPLFVFGPSLLSPIARRCSSVVRRFSSVARCRLPIARRPPSVVRRMPMCVCVRRFLLLCFPLARLVCHFSSVARRLSSVVRRSFLKVVVVARSPSSVVVFVRRPLPALVRPSSVVCARRASPVVCSSVGLAHCLLLVVFRPWFLARCPSVVSCLSPVVFRPLSDVRPQSSVVFFVCRPLPVVRRQFLCARRPSSVALCLCVRPSCFPASPVVRRPSFFARRPSPVVRRPSFLFTALCPSPMVRRSYFLFFAFFRRPPVVRRMSIFICRPSFFAQRFSSVARCPSSVVRRFVFDRRQLSVVFCPPSVVLRPSSIARPFSSVVRRPWFFVRRRPSHVVRRPLSVLFRPSSVVFRPSSSPVARRPLSVLFRPSSVVRHFSSVVFRPLSVDRRPSFFVGRHRRDHPTDHHEIIIIISDDI